MTWTHTIRRKALRRREELGLAADAPVAADQVLAALAEATGIDRYPLPPGDPLLCGAQAVLNLPMGSIFQDSSGSAAAQRFDAAHEYAHAFLHGGSCHCAGEDLHQEGLTAPAAVGADRVDGYSPRQRREGEANVYAAELLLPGPLLHRLFFEEGWTAARVADTVGISPALAEAQMVEALLLPPVTDGEMAEPPPSAQAVTLDPSQQAAAEAERGPLLLGAGPGTGKTKTLVGRCRFLVHRGVPAEQILALTFSRDAAQEMRERLAQAGVGAEGAGPWIGTFHSFGLDLLKRYGERIGLPATVRLLGTLDTITLLENNLPRLGLETLDNLYDPAVHLRGILSQISRAKDELCPPDRYTELCRQMQERAAEAAEEYAARPGKKLKKGREVFERGLLQAAKAVEVARCYVVYEELMAEQGFLDFGDLIYRAVQLLEACPDVRSALQAEFPHVLADEYQDVNRACARMIQLLAGETADGLWVVGDHRQSIYQFRGASPANVAAFGRDYPQGRRLELAVNYRSRPPVVDCFQQIARAMAAGTEEPPFAGWRAHRAAPDDAPPSVTVAVAPDEEGQADGIAATIESLRSRHPYDQQAILCRTHAQARALVDLLTARQIPVLYLGELLQRPEIKDLLCLLSLFCDSHGSGLLRVSALAEYAVPQEDALTFLRRIRAAEVPPLEGLQRADLRQDLSARAEPGLARLGRQMADLDRLKDDPAALLRHWLFEQSDFVRRLASGDAPPFLRLQRLLAVYQFYGLTVAFDRRVVAPAAPGGGRVQEFLTHLRRQAAAGESLQGAVPEGAEDLDAVRVMTAHKAKGLEYPVVYVPNLGAGQFPARGRHDGLLPPPGLAETAGDETDEELCLFFVALSRARDRLILSRAATGRGDREVAPSPLLNLLGPWQDGEPGSVVAWASGRTELPEPLEPPEPDAGRRSFSARALETYERCPRQYYYERELGLPGAWAGGAYPKFHGCVRQVLDWLEEERIAGRQPGEEAALARLDEVWAASGPVGHLHEDKYRESAEQMLRRASALPEGVELLGRPRLWAALAGGQVGVRPDTLYRRKSDGALVLARRLTGKAGDDDHRDKRLALLRRAAEETYPGRACVLELHYLQDGAVVEVAPPETEYQARLEANRVQKYEQAARGIRRRLFPPNPQAADECLTCAYALICPL